jgi:hypothetical protein
MADAKPTIARRAGRAEGRSGMDGDNCLKTRLAALLDTPEGKALIEEGRMFSAEELHCVRSTF